MPESTSNIEFAHRVHEDAEHAHGPSGQTSLWLGIAEALVLAVVAVATAWSGYEAARWNAISAKEYALQTQIAVLSQEKATLSGQEKLYDVLALNNWLNAKTAGKEELATLYERRLRPEFKIAFDEWIKLNPLKNESAPPGPMLMKGYHNAHQEEATKLNEEAHRHFEAGVETAEKGDQYVKITVLLATVLLLTALSQRFHMFWPRAAVVLVATVLLVIGVYSILVLPKA